MTIGVAIENLSDTDGCKDCFVSCSGDVKTIWTRNKKKVPQQSNNELKSKNGKITDNI